MNIVILGLSITSSWGNGHATTYRALMRELVAQGHSVLFLERDVPWYASKRDLPHPPYGRTRLYDSLDQLREQFHREIATAELVMLGSYVPEGVAVGEWLQRTAQGITAFYDIDTPVTLAKLRRGEFDYLRPDLIPGFHLYLSFTGGPALNLLEQQWGAPRACAFYCSVDPDLYYPEAADLEWDLGYLGTYSPSRQPVLDRLLLQPARHWGQGRFAVAGPQYPPGLDWPLNIARFEHIPPAAHRAFYNAQRFTLNITRRDMARMGYSPSVRIFEAAACGVPLISDRWEGLDTFLVPGLEILTADSPDEVLHYLRDLPEDRRRALGQRARARILSQHTAAHRAARLEELAREELAARRLAV